LGKQRGGGMEIEEERGRRNRERALMNDANLKETRYTKGS